MILKYLLCILLFLILRGISFSQENFRTNLDIITGLANESFIPLGNKLIDLGKEKIYQLESGNVNESGEFIFGNLRNYLRDYKVIVNENYDSADYKIIFSNAKITTVYKRIFTDKILGTKKVEREIMVAYDMDITDKKSSLIVYNLKFQKGFKDNFDLDKLSLVENNQYKFSHSELPPESKLDEILFPSIIIAASAAAIILFFVIRSK